jgi:SAM domain (Sterile alpha motif)
LNWAVAVRRRHSVNSVISASHGQNCCPFAFTAQPGFFDLDVSVLRYLTDQDLKEIGVLLGHRRKILAAIDELTLRASLTPETAVEASPKTQDSAERRQVTVLFSDLVGSTALSFT